MPYLCYQLKITSAFNRNIYRIMEIGGSRTFAELSDSILDAFEFDKDHLYMFSLNRKCYDPNGIYHPLAERENCADKICLRDVNPVVKNKYLYLYDFGDEWMFYITVMKVKEMESEIPVKVVQSQGELCQYPNWEEEWDDEEGYEEDYEETCSEKDQRDSSGNLVITPVDETDTVIQEKLMVMPALLQNMWIRLVNEDLQLAGNEEMELLYRLEEAGLVELDECDTNLNLKVKRGKTGFRGYDVLTHLKKRYDLEHTLLSLTGIYGVVEQDGLYELLCENAEVFEDSKELFEDTVERLSDWDFWTFMETADKKRYISSFCETILREILQKREKYPVKWYCTLSKDVQDALLSGDWRAACPVYDATFHYLFCERGWEPEDAEAFLEQLIKCVAMGYTEQEYFAWIYEAMEENNLSLTKSMRKVFLKFRNEFPSAVLKGYTWGEYEKNRKDGYHQLSLFEEELPFQ